MDYQRIYNQIIERAKSRQLSEYIEKHHIIPKCMGGSNKKENIVELTAREHFIVHWLLSRIYPDHILINRAFWLMANGTSPSKKRYKPSSRTYQEAREKTQMWLQTPKSEETKNKIKNHPTRKNNISLGIKKYYEENQQTKRKPCTEERRNKISKSKQGQNHTEETKNKIGKNQPKEKPSKRRSVLQHDKKGNLIKEWESIAQATKTLHYSDGIISMACSGKIKSAGGFIWKYK
jgi:hypothetical protein